MKDKGKGELRTQVVNAQITEQNGQGCVNFSFLYYRRMRFGVNRMSLWTDER